VASDSRALTLKLLADTADFQKKLANGSKDIDSIGERAAEFGKKAALAFAAAGAAIGAFAISAVKAAAEDETAQRRLAETIEATTGATAKQIEGVEQYIKQTSIAVGVTDDNLRPAFTRLVRSTQDVEEAQKLLNLALDLSAATGKPLETISMALGRAYDGNTTALGRLGLGLDADIIKSKDFDAIFQQLTGTFGNFAENESETTAKQLERVQIALDEAKESIGAALLPVVQELTAWILDNFIPALEAFIAGLTGQDGLEDSLTDTEKKFVAYGKTVRKFIDTVIDLKDEILIVGSVMLGVFTANKIAAGVAAIITLITTLRRALSALRASAMIAGVAQMFALNPLLGVGAIAIGAAVLAGANAAFGGDDTQGERPDLFFPTGGTRGVTGAGSGGGSGSGGGGGGGGGSGSGGGGGGKVTIPDLITGVMPVFPSGLNPTGNAIPSNFNVAGTVAANNAGVTINVNAPSAIDEEGFTRAVILALNNSNARNGGGGAILGGLVAE
jgi:hypothetical protein